MSDQTVIWAIDSSGHRYVREQDYEALKAERDLHRNRCAAILFGGGLDAVTAGEVQDWMRDYVDAKAERDALKAALNAPQPIAWGCRNADGEILDVISPAEHAEAEGDYTVPLYAKPVLP